MSTMPQATELAFSLAEFCRRAKIGRTKAYEEIRAGRLIARKNGKKTIITADDGRRYIDSLPRLQLPSA